ncbi:hypothetical protein CEP54_008935 [Fusarium duplospermum]|uniref:Uncharacterized protein n=1 Tax=Fusarium duplospermum TaxID=1325734 RepID=A0A428PT84_9HYPO|nr:hypothetical protein CEP54_008935 [Fusarium duplospermum]
MARRLAKDEGLDISQATGEMQMFLKRLPLFYDLITWPEVWSSGDAGLPVDDEDGDEVDESSTTQPAKVEEWLADLSIQQDDGAADEQPDAQTEQESDPSAPSSSQTVAGVLGLKGGPNEAPYRHHSRSGTV